MIARAYVEFSSASWIGDKREENLAGLRRVSREFGCDAFLANAEQSSSPEHWSVHLPFSLGWEGRPTEAVIDTRPLGINGVHQAATLAWEMFQAGSEGAKPADIAHATPDQLRAWGLLQLTRLCGRLRMGLMHAHWATWSRNGEGAIRTTRLAKLTEENDRFVKENEKLKTSIDALKFRIRKMKTPREHRWLPRWLRPKQKQG